MSWRDVEELISPLDPSFYNPAEEYAVLAEQLAELEELEELEKGVGQPSYHLLDEIPLEELPF